MPLTCADRAHAPDGLLARGLFFGVGVGIGISVRGLFLIARAAHRTAQELRLLVRLLRLEALPAARRLRRLLGGWPGIGRWLHALRLRAAVEGLPFAALAIVVAIALHIAVAVAETPMISPEGSLMAVVVVAAMLARLGMRLGMLRRGLEIWLREPTVIEQVVRVVLAEIVATVA